MFSRIKAKVHRLAKKIFTKIGIEIHYKNRGFFWVYLPLSREFIDTYEKYKIKQVSLVQIPSLHMMYQLLSYAVHLEGDIAQLGVYKGGSVALLASLVEKSGKKYHVFDTFEGLPRTKNEDNIYGHEQSEKPELADCPIAEVKNYLSQYTCIVYHKGFFPKTADSVSQNKFCFVYLDADLYQSTKDGLDFFYPSLSKGGCIVIDDFISGRWAGVETAVREFLETNSDASLLQLSSKQAVIIKR